MSERTRRLFAWICAVTFVVSAAAQDAPKPAPAKPAALKNPGLEDGELGKVPDGWFFPPVCKEAGYTLALSDVQPFAGKRCAVLSRPADAAGEGFGNILQSFDATGYRGKRVRFRAAVRADVAGDGNQAMLWLRVDRAKDETGFFDNMADRPIKAKEWKHYEIVGDVAEDAQSIVLGMLLLGNGSAALDDVSFEIVDKETKSTAAAKRAAPAPGLAEVVMAVTVNADEKAGEATFVYPLPLSYRDQVPLTFRLTVDPPAAAKAVAVAPGAGENHLLKLTLQDLGKHKKVNVEYRVMMLVGPTSFDRVPQTAKFPKEWPAEARPWLASTWCVDFEDEAVKAAAKEVRGESDDVMAVIRSALARSQKQFTSAKGRVNHLTSVEAMTKQGSCTSCANLVAALLRGAGVPARVLAGYPLWSGPLQTHYIVEAYVPDYGWYPVESTMGKSAWPNHQQVAVSIVPVEHESRAKAGPRPCAAGAVPFQSLTECEGQEGNVFAVGTLKPYCDHECRLVRPMEAPAAEWADALTWAKPRWAAWLKSAPVLKDGGIRFGPSAEEVKAKTLAELRTELR